MVSVFILAAGEGKRMRSKIPKVLHPLLGKPLLSYGVDAVRALNPIEVVAVVSPTVSREISKWEPPLSVTLAIQAPPRGTADAVKHGLSVLSKPAGNILILPGDVPLIRPETLEDLIEAHAASGSAMTILGAEVEDPSGYGRIVADGDGSVRRIVEDRDATSGEKAIKVINTGIMIIEERALREALEKVGTDNAQGEFYLTDLAEIFDKGGLKVLARSCEDPEEVHGVNDRYQLGEVQGGLLRRLIRRWQAAGVTFLNPDTTYLEPTVEIGPDTVLGPGVFLKGATRIGEGCTIGPGVVIEDSTIGDEVVIKPYSVIEESSIDPRAAIGPIAHLRPGSDIGEGAKVGNFVEVKKSRLAPGVKASHLTYLGDTTIGEGTNIGAGTITCNYDGRHKHPTTIGKDVFVGSNTALVAPVTVGDGAIIGAGSVITKKVPDKTLAVARARQQNFYRHIKQRKDT